MVDIHDIRYVRIGTDDLDTSVRFAVETLGLEPMERDAAPISVAMTGIITSRYTRSGKWAGYRLGKSRHGVARSGRSKLRRLVQVRAGTAEERELPGAWNDRGK